MKGGAERDPGARLFAWIWRRRFRRAKDPSALLQLLRRRRAALEVFARRAESRLADTRARPDPLDGAVWTHRPGCLQASISPSAVIGPVSGAGFGDHLTLHHDAAEGGFALNQRPNRAGAPRFELHFESYEFGGSYVSLALGVPTPHRRPGVGERFRLDIDLAASRPAKAFLRLNFARPGGVEAVTRAAELGAGLAVFHLDPAHAAGALREDDTIWLDLIIERPRMLEFSIREMALSLVART